MSRSRISISGPPLDEGTVRSLAAHGQTIEYVNIAEADWDSIAGCWAHVLGGPECLDADSVAALPDSIELVCFLGTGFESYMDVAALAARGIVGCFTPHANAQSTAEFALGLLIMGLRAIPIGIRQVERCEWNPPEGRSLADGTIGVVGFGHVGQEVVRMLTAGFGATPLVWNRTPKDDDIRRAGAEPADLPTIFSSCDAVTLHVNTSADGPPLIDAHLLALARRDLVLVNTARGSLVDPVVLGEVLRSRTDIRVLADVYPTEPACRATDEHGLLELGIERFLLTPHMAYSSDNAVRQMGAMVVENLAAHLAHREVPYRARAIHQ